MSTPEEVLDAEARAVEGEYIPKDDPRAQQGAPGAPEAESETAELIAAVLEPAFAVLAPNWEVTGDECRMLAQAYGPLADKYFPDLNLGVEVKAVLVTLVVFGPRLNKPRKVEPKKKPETAPAGVG